MKHFFQLFSKPHQIIRFCRQCLLLQVISLCSFLIQGLHDLRTRSCRIGRIWMDSNDFGGAYEFWKKNVKKLMTYISMTKKSRTHSKCTNFRLYKHLGISSLAVLQLFVLVFEKLLFFGVWLRMRKWCGWIIQIGAMSWRWAKCSKAFSFCSVRFSWPWQVQMSGCKTYPWSTPTSCMSSLFPCVDVFLWAPLFPFSYLPICPESFLAVGSKYTCARFRKQ